MAQERGVGINHPAFAHGYDWLAEQGPGRPSFDYFRRETAGRATGHTLELGAGGGYNVEYYDPANVERLDVTEPDATMLAKARGRAARARVPVTFTQARAEALPFADATFDTVVATLVFCSVADAEQGLREVRRVLKPGGRMLLAEHVRSEHAAVAGVQTAVTPITTRLAGNCHWNRDTASVVRQAGFTEVRVGTVQYATWWARLIANGLLPIIVIEARN